MRLLLLLMLVTQSLTNYAQQPSFEQTLYRAWAHQKPLPQLSLHSNHPIKPSTAYAIQQAYINLRLQQDAIAGYKAGLTSTAGQQKFKVTAPLYGVLLKSGERQTSQPLLLQHYGKLMLETELGFILAHDITEPPKTRQQLMASVKAVVPTIELPDLGFEQPSQLTGVDLIAANVAASGWLIGHPTAINEAGSLNSLQVSLYLHQQLVNQGQGSDALGDQWLALQWLIESLLRQGYPLKRDQLLITGALGKMIPAQRGTYHADFGKLGTIEFTVE